MRGVWVDGANRPRCPCAGGKLTAQKSQFVSMHHHGALFTSVSPSSTFLIILDFLHAESIELGLGLTRWQGRATEGRSGAGLEGREGVSDGSGASVKSGSSSLQCSRTNVEDFERLRRRAVVIQGGKSADISAELPWD